MEHERNELVNFLAYPCGGDVCHRCSNRGRREGVESFSGSRRADDSGERVSGMPFKWIGRSEETDLRTLKSGGHVHDGGVTAYGQTAAGHESGEQSQIELACERDQGKR